ncbi:putative S-adenosylmethionine-dependent methyltransferase/MSMEI_2290 [Phaeobacter sp. CECT 5382]|uniref:class I SAM-dependent methyltransferase n=1 Tax=Phaeobacter sp. CECT 5382 TaxID=1712645 RepID=UPI0006DB3A53|nr:class I SAM-dependent methyltransferase [Phaeobacter sp. CECT 5382]CUH88200.1 putative S-adenosylmethionine-dependent methyltransferase/MSMEI_2290 [Phaeobacter sp. CECT 5382]
MQQIAPVHFWFEGRRRLVDLILSRDLEEKADVAVDLGCGAGESLSGWKKHAWQVIGIDGHADLIAADFEDPTVSVMTADVADLPLADESADLVLALDVLEHVPDRQALQEACRILSPGGTLLVAVPAYQWLWSYRDEDAGHLRRYSKRGLRQLIESAGLTVERIRWYQCLLFPMVIVARLLGRRGPRVRDLEDNPPRLFNRLLLGINLFEVRLASLGIGMPFGSSILVTARKPDDCPKNGLCRP